MTYLPSLFLFFGLVTGQLIKIPLLLSSGPTILDFTILTLNIWGLISLKMELKKPPLWLILGFGLIFIATLSLLMTPLKLSAGQYLTSTLYIGRLASYLLLGWLIYCRAFKFLRFNFVLIFSGITLAFLGLLQLIFIPNLSFLANNGWDPHYFRLASTLLDPNFTGVFLVLTLLLLLGKKGLRKSKFWIFAFILVYLASVFTFSRSTALLLGVSFLTFSIMSRSVKMLMLTLLLSLGFLMVFKSYTQTVAQPRNIDRQQSAQSRFNSWEQGWKIFTSSPLLGVGFNNYRYALDQYHLAPSSFIQSRGASGNDSSLLFVASTTGVIGLTSYLLFFSSLLIKAWGNFRQGNRNGLILCAALVGLLVNSFFINSFFYPWILLWIIIVASQDSLQTTV